MKIFVCRAPSDLPYSQRVIETLGAHDVWQEQSRPAERAESSEVLRRLEWCEVLLYLHSPASAASRQCQRTLEMARRLQREIVPVLIDSRARQLQSTREWQLIDLSDKLTAANVARLLNTLLLLERERTPAGAARDSRVFRDHPAELVSGAVRALETADYAEAARLLERVKAKGYQSRFVPVDRLLRLARSTLAQSQPARELEREYQHVAALFNFESTRDIACEALADFRREFGDYDPRNLRRFCAEGEAKAVRHVSAPPRVAAQSAPTPRARTIAAAPPRRERERLAVLTAPARPAPAKPDLRKLLGEDEELNAKATLPLLRWREVPHGTVTIASQAGQDEDFGEVTEQVDNFVMSQYPVTNAQFKIFADAPDGYRNPRWWEFSRHAQRFFRASTGAAPPRFDGDALPRENVNWYEAMAFANWLGRQLRMTITLPTIGQWQRAAKGDDDRYYPWGDEYREEHCNTVETGLKMTTPVDRYQRGASPYGIYDLAGNVWEWTLNTAAAGEEGRDYQRAVTGGSFVSPCDRANTSFRYYLDPRSRYSSVGIRLVALT